MVTALACDTSLWTDDVWVIDSTPVECGRSRDTARRSDLGREFEATIGAAGLQLLRPARKGEPPRPGTRFFRPLRQTIESIFDTVEGAAVRVYQRLPALTAVIWHNDHTGQPVKRSLTAYDH